MIVLGNWFFEFNGKAIPDSLIIGDPQLGSFPDFRPLAAALRRLSSIRSKTEFQGSVAAVGDLALKLDKSGVLLRTSLEVETARSREIRPLEAIVKRLTPTIA